MTALASLAVAPGIGRASTAGAVGGVSAAAARARRPRRARCGATRSGAPRRRRRSARHGHRPRRRRRGGGGADEIMRSALSGIEPPDAASFLAAPTVLGVVAALARLLPARRAASTDPAAALRHRSTARHDTRSMCVSRTRSRFGRWPPALTCRVLSEVLIAGRPTGAVITGVVL